MAGGNKSPRLIDRKAFSLSKSTLSKIILILLKLLILVIMLGLLGGILKTFYDLRLLFSENVEIALKQLLLNVITLLAIVEVIRTVISYLNDGRVRVTFVVDTILIVLLNEMLSLWFKEPEMESVVMLSLVIITLIIVRIFAIKYPPSHE